MRIRMAAKAFVVLALSAAASIASADARPRGLVEPSLHIQPGGAGHPRVALTFDACMGRTDTRILDALVAHRIPATIFVTRRWLERNRAAFDTLRAHPDLFEIEDHGARHVPAIDRPVRVYGIASAGSPGAVAEEVRGGASAIEAAGGSKPSWFRGATALYSPSAIRQIRKLGFDVAGFSVNGDGGATFSAALAEKTVAHARDGDVVISHINQPTHPAGGGVVKGILDLEAKGFRFVKLNDDGAKGTDGTTGAFSAPLAAVSGSSSSPAKKS